MRHLPPRWQRPHLGYRCRFRPRSVHEKEASTPSPSFGLVRDGCVQGGRRIGNSTGCTHVKAVETQDHTIPVSAIDISPDRSRPKTIQPHLWSTRQENGVSGRGKARSSPLDSRPTTIVSQLASRIERRFTFMTDMTASCASTFGGSLFRLFRRTCLVEPH